MMGITWKVIVLAATVGTITLLIVQMLGPEEPIDSAPPKTQPGLRPPDPAPTAAMKPQYQVPSVRSILEGPSSPSSAGAEQSLSASPQPNEPKAGGVGPTGPQASAPTAATYVVREGDTPGGIAQRYFGDATRWPEIAHANQGLKSTALQLGQVLQLPSGPTHDRQPDGPAEQRTNAAVTPVPSLAVHRVGPGDSLYELARKYYGDPSLWSLIRDANPELERSGVRELRVDLELIIPALPKANP